MAGQPEQPVYDPLVYQLEVTDPVQGGVGGVANLSLLQLADRTAWLKQRIDLLTSGALIPPTVAPLNGPAFTGSTTAPNVAPGDDSTLIANTDFVQTAKHGLVVVPVSGGANVTLTQPQWGVGILVFSGVLSANIAAIFPSRPGAWIVENAASGFYITCKTAAGTGVDLAPGAGRFNAIWCDGTNVYPQVSPFALNLTNPMVIAALGFTPVQQGGGTNQLNNKVYVGWSAAARLRAQVDGTDLGNVAMETAANVFSAPQAEANNVYWSGRNTGGGLQSIVGVDNLNNTTMFAGPSGALAWRVVTNTLAANLLWSDTAGNFNTAGDVTAGHRLRAPAGTAGSGDANAAALLSDFASAASSGSNGWATIPSFGLGPADNLIVQWGAVAIPAGTINGAFNLPRNFPTNFAAIVLSYGSNTPPQSPNVGVLGAQPGSLTQFNASNTNPGGGTNGCFFIAIGW